MGMSVCVPNLKTVRADGGRGGSTVTVHSTHIYQEVGLKKIHNS